LRRRRPRAYSSLVSNSSSSARRWLGDFIYTVI
jgi:hypothetical protein